MGGPAHGGRRRTVPARRQHPRRLLRRRRHDARRIRLDITPVRVDRATTQATLDLGGTTVVASHDKPRATQITWPLAGESQTARLVFDPPLPAKAGALQDDGPWSLFRLFSRAKLNSGHRRGPTTSSFQVGDREAVFEIHVSSTANPFDPALLQDFKCPAVSGT